MAIMITMSLSACGNQNQNNESQTNTTKEATEIVATTEKEISAQDSLTGEEKLLFNALVRMIKDFYEPSAVRVLDIGDYTNYEEKDLSSLSQADADYLRKNAVTIVVRLQGENKIGGTLSHYYMICLEEGKDTEWSRSGTFMRADLERTGKYGEYIELEDSYTIEENATNYNIGRINKALTEHWEELGL